MVRESGISATKPIFSTYLLPSLKLPFTRSASSTSSSSASGSPASSATTTPASSPPNNDSMSKSDARQRLSRTAPNTLRCSSCSSDIAYASQVISKGFTGRYGRAYLVAPPPLPAPQILQNIREGKSENRQLVTGWHLVADISCGTCSSKLGWKYVDAKERAQRYKVGKYILETERIVTYRSWEDAVSGRRADKHGLDELSEDDVVFDSDNDDECEDVFAGTWDPEVVGGRRSRMVDRRSMARETQP